MASLIQSQRVVNAGGILTNWFRDWLRKLERRALPEGGTTGQVLSKTDGTDYNVEWVAASGGSLPSGTLNYTLRYDGSSWAANGNALIDASGNLALNTTVSSTTRIKAEATGDFDTVIQIRSNSNTGNWARMDFFNQNVVEPAILYYQDNGNFNIRTEGQPRYRVTPTEHIWFDETGTEDMRVDANGDLEVRRRVYAMNGDTLSTANQFYMGAAAADRPAISFDSNDYFEYNRTDNSFRARIGGTTEFEVDATATTINSLSGSGARMVTADASGNLATQSIPSPSFIVLAQTTNQNVGGANGTEVWWNWQTQDRIDSDFTHSTSTNPSRITVGATGWYRVRFAGNVQQTGGARSTLQGIYRVNGGSTARDGTVRDYSRGQAYGNLSPGLEHVINLTAGDYIEVGTRVEDTDGVYTINSIGGEVLAGESRLIIELIP